jgi:hypothetical protein
MQRIFKITLIISLLTLFSCTDYEIKKYKIKNPSAKQREEIDNILSEKGIGDVEIDSANGEIIIEYIPNLNTLRRIEEYLEENDLLLEELPKINPKDLEEDVKALELDTLLEEITEELQNKEDSIIETVSTQLATDTNVVVKKDTLTKK